MTYFGTSPNQIDQFYKYPIDGAENCVSPGIYMLNVQHFPLNNKKTKWCTTASFIGHSITDLQNLQSLLNTSDIGFSSSVVVVNKSEN